MKAFLVYTALRIGLFLVTFAVVLAVASLIFGYSATVWFASFVLAALLSSLIALRALEGPRERFALVVQQRAERASARFEEMRSKEDED